MSFQMIILQWRVLYLVSFLQSTMDVSISFLSYLDAD